MGIKVAELNTLSDAKGITGIRFFNEMEDTNESILRIALPPKHEKHKFVKARLYCMRVDVAVIIHRTKALWSDQRLTPIM